MVHAWTSDAECQSGYSYNRKRKPFGPRSCFLDPTPWTLGLENSLLEVGWSRSNIVLWMERCFTASLAYLVPTRGQQYHYPLWQSKMSPNVAKYTPGGKIIPIENYHPISNDWWIYQYLYIFINVTCLSNPFLMIFAITNFFD